MEFRRVKIRINFKIMCASFKNLIVPPKPFEGFKTIVCSRGEGEDHAVSHVISPKANVYYFIFVNSWQVFQS